MTDRTTALTGLRALVAETPAADLPALIGELEGLKAQAWARLTIPVRPAAEPERLVDAAGLARRLSLPETWVRDAARRGRIPCVFAGVHVRFDPDAVIEAMKSGKAALADREKLSKRGRRAVEHRIERPVKAPKCSEIQGAATALLPRQPVEERTR
jgi:hypothetical protein